MTNENGPPKQETGESPHVAGDGKDQVQGSEAECQRLQRRVQQLEAECAGYHRALTALLRERCDQTDTSSDADLDRLVAEALRLGDFDQELQQLLQER